MSATDILKIGLPLSVRVQNGGLFVSRGRGTHPTRIIDSHELIFVRSGVLGIFEADKRFQPGAGDILHLWPGRRHGGTAIYPADLSFYWIHFHLDTAGAGRTRVSNQLALDQHKAVARPDRLTELFRLFLDDQETGRLTPLSGSLLMAAILTEAAMTTAANDTSPGASLVAQAEQYMVSHFHEPVSASVVARQMRCNPDYLGRVFRSARGKTLTETIHHLRIRHARKLLMDSTMNIDEIAAACGFNDAVYFRRVFLRAEGLPPGKFRRLYGRLHINTD
ncbi:MAG: AraC family transcriptional regulator [Verrucomicrobia bacterium]|nr:AraC family transcriptional regulator [Verrucomicrobiota bacterium]